MAITAKVILQTKSISISTTGLLFYPDYGDGRNKEWSTSTPHLELKMTVTNEVADLFDVGGRYTLTFDKEE